MLIATHEMGFARARTGAASSVAGRMGGFCWRTAIFARRRSTRRFRGASEKIAVVKRASGLMAGRLRTGTWILVKVMRVVRNLAGRGAKGIAAVGCGVLLAALSAAAPAAGRRVQETRRGSESCRRAVPWRR
jgi:hypothetical protein